MIKIILIFLIETSLLTISRCAFDFPNLIRQDRHVSEDGRLTFTGLAAKYGHPAEEHHVVTSDGYILTVFHLPGNKNKVAALVHGNGLDSDCFIVRGKTSLAIVLADRGYDVWVIGLRGSTYGRSHLFIDPDKEQSRFFNYTFYEHGTIDVPECIDYILEKTGQSQLIGIGYSAGTTDYLVMGSEKPEYNKKLKAFIALAPVCFLKHQRGYIAQFNKHGEKLFAGVYETLSRYQNLIFLLQKYCVHVSKISYNICVKELLFKTNGPNESGFEPEFMSTFYAHFPAGTSTKLNMHLSQLYRRDEFAKFDYGLERNLEVYHSPSPPKFDLSKVTMPVVLVQAHNDYSCGMADVERLSKALPNVVNFTILPDENFSHFDFVYGRHMTENLYPFLLKLIDRYA